MDNRDEMRLSVNTDWCKACGICIKFCPKNVLEMKSDKIHIKDIDNCIKCGQCELRCPDYAICLEVNKNE